MQIQNIKKKKKKGKKKGKKKEKKKEGTRLELWRSLFYQQGGGNLHNQDRPNYCICTIHFTSSVMYVYITYGTRSRL